MADDMLVKWFDLARFGVALKVVPQSPLRGIAMTCLEVLDEAQFAKHVHGDLAGASDSASARELSARVKAWQERMAELGFRTRAEFIDPTDTSLVRAYRVYSDRTTFTLSELQQIVPGVTADDYKLMPVGRIVQRAEVTPGMAADWKQFTQTVLANEAVGVWMPKVNPFDKPYAQARTLGEVWEEHTKAGKFPIVGSEPTTRWFGNALEKARYRENALIGFYPDLQTALEDGLQQVDLQEVNLPYALPLFVEKSGRIVAVRDVRHIPEVLSLPPHNVFGSVAQSGEGLVVKMMRAARAVEAVYREEAPKWRAWKDSSEAIDGEALATSIQRVVETDAAFCARFSAAEGGKIDLLVDGDRVKMDGQPLVMKPLADWREDHFRLLGRRARRYVRDGSVDDAFENLTALDARKRDQDAERAKDAAKEALRRVAQSVLEAGDEPKEKVRHEDAGVKIGGARKDFHRRAMTADDLEGMTEYERKSLVVKKNVWPPLDYEAMREAGVTAQAALAIKLLKDAIAVEPDRRRNELTTEPEADYVKAVSAARDALADVKTLDEFAQACLKLFDLGRAGTTYIYGGSAMQFQLGSDACGLLSDSSITIGWKENARTEARVPQKIRREISRKIREGSEWNYLIKPKREKTEAEKEAESEKSEQERELHRPHLDVVERIGGEDWRGGRDITAQDLMDHFGFRAIEFGNWLPQDERQTVLNMAFDSLCDLADALGLPPKAISFDGDLAVAFGSRGRGGKNAALAHFEPGRNVINLTRMKGAGTLAHEWFHALDYQLDGKRGYLTERGRPRFDGDPVPKLVAAMKRRPATPEEVVEVSQQNAMKGKEYAASWCYAQSSESRVVINKALDEWFEKARMKMYDVAISFFSSLPDHEKNLANRPQALHCDGAVSYSTRSDLSEEIVGAMRAACDSRKSFTKVAPKVENNINWMLANMGRWVTVDAARELGVTLDERFLGDKNGKDTWYYQQAKELDKRRSSPYWATELEMFARAGAQYVHYELADKGVRSDYLVYGADEDRYANHPIGNPNPPAIDRAALRGHFSALIEDYRVRLVRSAESEATAEP